MRKLSPIIIVLFCYLYSNAQDMSVTKLNAILTEVSDTIVNNNSQWRFKIKEVPFICIADSTHNRMRIISPIGDSNRLTEDLKLASLMANFHTALDVKYAISDDVIWSAFIHPLKELSRQQVISAVSQVYYANVNFGSTFSSTSLVFPGRKRETQETPEPEPKNNLQKI